MTSPRLPVRVRQSLNVESGLNDGICVPLFLIALAVAQAEEGAIGHGHAVAARRREDRLRHPRRRRSPEPSAAAVVVYAGGRRLVDATWLQVVPLAGALLAFGLAEAIGGSGFIAAFVGGGVFGGLRRHRGGDVSYLMEQAGAVLAAVTFVVFGAVLLGPAIGDLTWQIALYAVLSLTRRPHGPGRDLDARNGRAAPDRRLPRLVRAARRRVDRLRAARSSRRAALPHERADPHDGVRDASGCPCSRTASTAAPLADALRRLARRAAGDGHASSRGGRGARAPLAPRARARDA